MRSKILQRGLGMLTRFMFVTVLLMVLANIAGAYTIVFRDGHRIEVPPVFTVANKIFTYEAATGINKTVQLILIDVAATENANNEAPGSFFKHAEQTPVASPVPLIRHAERTLTNIDLEPNRQRRIESEKNYEKRRVELGLPSIEETRRQQAREEESTLALARQRAEKEARDEAYWRGRASELRTEIGSVDAQIDYLRSRLGGSWGPLINYGSVATGFPFVSAPLQRQSLRDFGTMAAPRPGAPHRALIQTGVLPLRPQNPRRPFGGFGAPLLSPFAFPIQSFAYGDSYESAGLRDNLNNLLVRRAGLESLWRELEDEARIARAPQVWLVP
jgi:hypothetical protein